MPFGAGEFPLAIGEDDGGLGVIDYIFELREEVFLYEALFVGEPQRVVPLVERIIDPHVQPFPPTGLSEIEQQVALGADIDCIPETVVRAIRLFVVP